MTTVALGSWKVATLRAVPGPRPLVFRRFAEEYGTGQARSLVLEHPLVHNPASDEHPVGSCAGAVAFQSGPVCIRRFRLRARIGLPSPVSGPRHIEPDGPISGIRLDLLPELVPSIPL